MKIFSLILAAILLAACATPLPDHRCSKGAQIEGPDDTERTIDLACQRFAQRADIPIEDTSLDGVEITIRQWREPVECENNTKACARLLPEPQRIDVYREDWRASLIHEVYHVLLWRTRPDIHTDDHHRWLFERKLCVRREFCGYGLKGRP